MMFHMNIPENISFPLLKLPDIISINCHDRVLDKKTGENLTKYTLLIARRHGKLQGMVRKASSPQSSQQLNKPGF